MICHGMIRCANAYYINRKKTTYVTIYRCRCFANLHTIIYHTLPAIDRATQTGQILWQTHGLRPETPVSHSNHSNGKNSGSFRVDFDTLQTSFSATPGDVGNRPGALHDGGLRKSGKWQEVPLFTNCTIQREYTDSCT